MEEKGKSGKVLTGFRKSRGRRAEDDALPVERDDAPAAAVPIVARSDSSVRGTTQKGKRLSVMPFAVLLPSLGSVRGIASCQKSLVKRHRFLAQAGQSAAEEISKRAIAEESMLNQVLQWLRVEEEGG